MSSIVLAGRSYKYGAKLYPSQFTASILSATHRTSRAASLNSAIGRGLRKSKGVGFRGKERSQEKSDVGNRERTAPSDGLVRRTAELSKSIPKGQLTHDAWRKQNAPSRQESRDESDSNGSIRQRRGGDRDLPEARERLRTQTRRDGRSESSSRDSIFRLRRGKMDIAEGGRNKRRSRAGRFNDPNFSFGKRALERRAVRKAKLEGRDGGLDESSKKPGSDVDNIVSEGRRRPTMTSAALRAVQSDREALERNPGGSRLSKGRQAFLTRTAESSQRKSSEENVRRPGSEYADETRGYNRNHRDRPVPIVESRSHRKDSFGRDNEEPRFTSPRQVNDRLPLSIPYTTPASEFLYGTSVVEAALKSRREPRRLPYKLYIYQGEKRSSGESPDSIERLAKKNKIPIVYHTDSPRLLDKMSGGRPHNGYVLEASPLPKLPITSLGALVNDSAPGFMVNLDHQSREDAAINGTSPLIPLPYSLNRQGRKPFVLLLDSILDPGNLGGIIRTASFLGINAIALSTRNSAPLSPVVLKASAGASESITLFSVSKPAGFVTDSKRAGWKVYAAVAPQGPSANQTAAHNEARSLSQHRPVAREVLSSPGGNDVPSITIDDLLISNPLNHDPCILMLGNEGEGLRWNLRAKADVEIAIQGSAHRGGVDSLNVSVAAGILCQAFASSLSRKRTSVTDNVKTEMRKTRDDNTRVEDENVEMEDQEGQKGKANTANDNVGRGERDLF